MEGLFAALLHMPAVRTVAKAAVKGGLGFVDAARGVAVVAGRQWDQRVTGVVSWSKVAGEPTAAEVVLTEVVVAPVESSARRRRRPARPPARVEAPAADAPAAAAPAAAQVADEITAAGKLATTRIDGIGPKAAAVLAAAGVTTLAQLATMDGTELRAILSSAGPPYRSMDPGSWPDQARRLTGAEAPAAAGIAGEPIAPAAAPAAASIVTPSGAESAVVESAVTEEPPAATAPSEERDTGQDPAETTTPERTVETIQVDGIGAGVAGVLAAAGVTTLAQLAAMDGAQLGAILSSAGPPYRSMDPDSWPDQARRLLESAR